MVGPKSAFSKLLRLLASNHLNWRCRYHRMIGGDALCTVDNRDVLLLERDILGISSLSPAQIQQADLCSPGNGDGVLTVSDLLLLQQRVLGEVN